MLGYSLLIPQRDASARLAAQLHELEHVLDGLKQPYEIICIDDGSCASSLAELRRLQAEHRTLRIVRLDEPCGLGVALSVGIGAARGEKLLAMAAGPQYRCSQVPQLLNHLKRADFVQGKRIRQGLDKLWYRIARIPRSLLLGMEVRDPGCLFWAARREAVAELDLGRRLHRSLAVLVAARGYRVDQVLVEAQPAPPYPDEGWTGPADLLAAWWHRRHHHPYQAYEIEHDVAQPILPFTRSERTVSAQRKSA